MGVVGQKKWEARSLGEGQDIEVGSKPHPIKSNINLSWITFNPHAKTEFGL
jgi:hypothetical protein